MKKLSKKELVKIARKAILDATSAKLDECANHPFEPWYEGYRACICDLCDDIYEFVSDNDYCTSETLVIRSGEHPTICMQGYRRAYLDAVTAYREALEKQLD